MSVYCDKVLGYMIDVTEQFNKMDRDSMDKWLNYEEEHKDTYKNIGFITDYGMRDRCKGDITLIYDGMSGDYCKLAFILEYIYDSTEDDCDLVKSINRELAKVEVPIDVKEKLEKAYKEIFGDKENIEENIALEYLIHWY